MNLKIKLLLKQKHKLSSGALFWYNTAENGGTTEIFRPSAYNNIGFGQFFPADISIYKACVHTSYFTILIKIENV